MNKHIIVLGQGYEDRSKVYILFRLKLLEDVAYFFQTQMKERSLH